MPTERSLQPLSMWLSLGVAFMWAALGAALSYVPAVQHMEQSLGLPVLFHLRGARPPPNEVLIVRIDQQAAGSIFLPSDPERYYRCSSIVVDARPAGYEPLPSPTRLTEWPRCIHASLIKSLTEAGARLIAFDVLFRPRPGLPAASMGLRTEENRMFAEQVQRAGNVLLSRRLDVSMRQSPEGALALSDVLSPLSPDLEHTALGSGIFLLPDVEKGRFDRFVAFAPNTWLMSSFPSLAVQAYLSQGYQPFRELLVAASPPAGELLASEYADFRSPGALEALTLLARQLFVTDANLQSRMAGVIKRNATAGRGNSEQAEAAALIRIYASPSEQYFNFFGPPGAVRNIGYEEVLDPKRSAQLRQQVAGKVVFIGRSELINPETDDYFHTVFSGTGGIDTSGVELAATAFANLLQGDSIEPLSHIPSAMISFVFGLAVVLLMTRLSLTPAIGTVMALILIYIAIALWLFSRWFLWLPLVVPLGVQCGIGIALLGSWVHWRTRNFVGEMRTLFGRFVPPHLIDKLVKQRKSLGDLRETLTAACMATDVERYVTVAEGLTPAAMSQYLDEYFSVLFEVVAQREGLVMDVVGDSMMAVWPDRNSDRAVRAAVCDACLELGARVDAFNQSTGRVPLPTRVGVDWGSIALGPVGAGLHYEFRAIGDPVNTSSRIQGINKHFGTRVLVSQSVIEGLEEYLVREIGTFLLRGKTIPVTLFELMTRKAGASSEQLDLCARFAQALQCVREGHLQRARVYFQGIARDFPGDGPAAFYLRQMDTSPAPDLNIIPMN